MMLGFGETETNFEKQEFDFVNNFIMKRAKEFKGDKYDFHFDDNLMKDLKKVLDRRGNKYKTLSDEYRHAKTFPDRYSYYWVDVVGDWWNICVIFDFRHVNRRYALSPDGWAVMAGKKVCYVDVENIRDNL